MRVAVVVNPLAGRSGLFEPRPAEMLVARVGACAGASVSMLVTRGPGDGRVRTLQALDEGAEIVVAWGGDGTVNEVASVLVGTSVPLGIVPTGSGNGLARDLDLPHSTRDALKIAFGRATRSIDVAAIGDRAFVNVAGFGLDAQVARSFNIAGRSRGFRRYIQLTVSEIFRYQPRSYAISWDGGSFAGPALIVAFANSRQYGHGACVAPEALLDDGALDMVIVRPTSAVGDLWRARRLFTRTILDDARVEFARVRGATIQSAPDLCGHIDGELLSELATQQVSVRPRALRVCVAS